MVARPWSICRILYQLMMDSIVSDIAMALLPVLFGTYMLGLISGFEDGLPFGGLILLLEVHGVCLQHSSSCTREAIWIDDADHHMEMIGEETVCLYCKYVIKLLTITLERLHHPREVLIAMEDRLPLISSRIDMVDVFWQKYIWPRWHVRLSVTVKYR
jgi:hypothetical protein